MMTAKEYRALQAKLRGEVSDDEVQRAVRSVPRHYVGDSMKFAGGPASLGQNQDRGLSPVIWDNFKLNEMRHNPSIGSWFFDDFLNVKGTVTSNVGTYASVGGYKSYETTSGTLTQGNTFLPGQGGTKANGVLEFLTTAAADSQIAIEAGDGNGGSWALTGNVYPKLAFECRIYVNMTTVQNLNLFFGLAEKGLAVVVGSGSIFTAATPAVRNTKSQIGFYTLSADPTLIMPTFCKNGQAVQGITSVSAVNTAVGMTAGFNSGIGTLVSKTWTKLGLIYDPFPHDGKFPPGLLQFYQDGKLLGWVTDCSVATFPTATVLTPLLNVGSNHAGTSAITVDVDWISTAIQVDA